MFNPSPFGFVVQSVVQELNCFKEVFVGQAWPREEKGVKMKGPACSGIAAPHVL